MWKLFLATIAIAEFVCVGVASAEIRAERKIAQVGGPETRTRCINNLKTKGIPSCTLKNFEVRCEDTWIITCSEWATDFRQHEFFLVGKGPDVEPALKQAATKALTDSVVAAAAAAIATPGEVGSKVAAGVAAFKIAIAANMTGQLAQLRDKYSLDLEERSSW